MRLFLRNLLKSIGDKVKLNRRLTGFTLIEVIIAMVLSGILLTIAIRVLLMFSSIVNDEKHKMAETSDILLLQSILDDSFDKCFQISPSEDGIKFIYDDSSYLYLKVIETGVVLHNETISDTFKILIDSLQIGRLMIDTSSVEDFLIVTKMDNQICPLYFRKKYTNLFLFNLKY